MKTPLRRHDVLQSDWGTTKPRGTARDGTARTHVGTINVDGDTYDVWKRTQVNKPNITGVNQNFDQYFSIRQNARQCGHISVSQHFSEWETLGLPLGKLYEAKLLVEAQDGTGTIDFTTATVGREVTPPTHRNASRRAVSRAITSGFRPDRRLEGRGPYAIVDLPGPIRYSLVRYGGSFL